MIQNKRVWTCQSHAEITLSQETDVKWLILSQPCFVQWVFIFISILLSIYPFPPFQKIFFLAYIVLQTTIGDGHRKILSCCLTYFGIRGLLSYLREEQLSSELSSLRTTLRQSLVNCLTDGFHWAGEVGEYKVLYSPLPIIIIIWIHNLTVLGQKVNN